jgi:hypothetical protein
MLKASVKGITPERIRMPKDNFEWPHLEEDQRREFLRIVHLYHSTQHKLNQHRWATCLLATTVGLTMLILAMHFLK